MCAFYAERCVLSSCSGMFYDGVFGTKATIKVVLIVHQLV
jgi:hypothetical protein